MNHPMARQMMNNPAMMQRAQEMFGGQIPGMPGGAAAAQPAEPKLGEVCKIQSMGHLQGIIKQYPGIVIDFWSERCPPCMRFKPVYEATARANQNANIVFCAVNT